MYNIITDNLKISKYIFLNNNLCFNKYSYHALYLPNTPHTFTPPNPKLF